MTTLEDNGTTTSHATAAERGVHEGATVLSGEGSRIGRVEEVRGPYLRIRRRMFGGQGFWLDMNHVQTVEGDEVRLGLGKDEVRANHVPAEVATEPTLDARVDHLLSDAEVEAQRKRLEQGLKK